MEPVLIPQPKKAEWREGSFALPGTVQIGLESQDLYPAAQLAMEFLKRTRVNIAVPTVPDTLALSTDGDLKKGGYRLEISPAGIRIAGRNPAAVSHGLQTLRQIVEQSGRALPCGVIDDWPDFADRGVYYDVCRGRVPKQSGRC